MSWDSESLLASGTSQRIQWNLRKASRFSARVRKAVGIHPMVYETSSSLTSAPVSVSNDASDKKRTQSSAEQRVGE